MIIIPAVDIRGGKVVRLYQGDFNKESRYNRQPLEAARHWQEQGARLIHVVDLDGALEGKPQNKDIIIEIIKALSIDVEVGGGLREKAIVEQFLVAGAARVVLGSKAICDYSFLDNFKEVINRSISVSIDAKFMRIEKSDIIMDIGDSGWQSSKELSLKNLLEEFYSRGIRYVNFTNIQLDGTLRGVDIDSVKAVFSLVQKFKGLRMIASGGVASLSDIAALSKIKGLYGVIVGKALYEGKLDFKEALGIVEGS
jgi:phosphoribosylformimino-5-aminoimidazole carboxamide ribotide isomerase